MKLVFRTILSIFFIMVLARPALAQEEKLIAPMPPIDGQIGQLFGQNHWYSVVFRGNGEAVVSTRILFTNGDTAPQSILSFRIPKVMPADPLAFQVIRQRQCIQYSLRGTPMPDGGIAEPACLRYQEPDAYNWYGPAKYQKAGIEYTGDTLNVTLPQPIEPNKSGSILLYYRAFGYAKKNITGSYTFAFETLQAQEAVQQAQVGISTDSDLILRGGKGAVNYRFEDMGMAAKGMSEAAAPMMNTRMDSFYQQIGSGSIVKTASNLQALESYSVKGSYADNRLKLYAKEGLIGFIVLAVVVAGGMYILKLTLKGLRGTSKTSQSPATTSFLAMFGLSFVAAVCILGYTILLVFLTNSLSSYVVYDMRMPITILLLIVSLGVYGLLLFAPAVILGIRLGWAFGLGTIGLTTVWLILALILYVLIGFSGKSNQYYPMGIELMDRATSSVAPMAEPQMTYPEGSGPMPPDAE